MSSETLRTKSNVYLSLPVESQYSCYSVIIMYFRTLLINDWSTGRWWSMLIFDGLFGKLARAFIALNALVCGDLVAKVCSV